MRKSLISFLTFSLTFTCAFGQLVPYRVSEQWGYSDTGGKIVIEPQYRQADFFNDNVAFVQNDSFYFLINNKGEKLSPPFTRHGKFNNGLCPVMDQYGRAYYINQSATNVFNTTYRAAENFSEGLAVVSVKGKLGIIDTKGKWVREANFDTSSLYFKSGFLLATSKGRYFFIDKHGKELVLPDSIKPAGIYSEGLAAVYVEHHVKTGNAVTSKMNLGFIDTAGKLVLDSFVIDSMDYTDYVNYEKDFIDGKAIVKVKNQLAFDHYFIDINGKVSPLFSFAQHLGDSLYLGVAGYYMPTIRIYDRDFYVMGDFGFPIKSVGLSGNGLIAVQEKDGLWGYCNSNTQKIIPFKYDMAYQFNNGYAIVVNKGRMGVINLKGKEFFRD